jgi:hypothetical protein
MLDLIAGHGIDRDVPAQVANALGLSATDQGWPSHQVSSLDTNGNHHALAVSRGIDQDIALSLLTPDGIPALRIHRDGTLVAELNIDYHTGQLTMRNRVDVRKELDAEFAYWTALFKSDK